MIFAEHRGVEWLSIPVLPTAPRRNLYIDHTQQSFLVHDIYRRAPEVEVHGQANVPSGTGHSFRATLTMPDDQTYLPAGRTVGSLSDVELAEAAWRKHLAAGYYDYM